MKDTEYQVLVFSGRRKCENGRLDNQNNVIYPNIKDITVRLQRWRYGMLGKY